MKDIRAKILSNKNICADYYKMTLDAPYIAKHAKPGQFVQVKCSDGTEPLLRRPFSVHRVRSSEFGVRSIEILYEVIGKGTEILSKRKAGEFLDVLGPLGNGFGLPQTTPVRCGGNRERLPTEAECESSSAKAGRTAILIAGGIGVAPLVFLAEKLAELRTIVLIGAKTKNLVLCEKDFKRAGAEVHIATDDGSRGCKGVVSKLFEKVLRTTKHERRTTIYVCGPNPMLKCIAGICKRRRIGCEVSLEEAMACGIGACLGCVVKVKGPCTSRFTPVQGRGGYKLVCKDGPVFNADEVIWG